MYGCFWNLVNDISRSQWNHLYKRICDRCPLFGLLHLWRYTRARKFEMGGTGNLIAAILLFILSAIGFFKLEVILSFLPFVTGSLLIVDGFVKIPLIKEMWIGEVN